jgi:tetratricopeptide (TPR) repeat protein
MSESGEIPAGLGADTAQSADGSSAASTLDPTAAALAVEAAKTDSELAKEATAYFRKQSHLVEVQTEHLHEQRAVNLSLLKLKRIGERFTVALRLFVILVAIVIGIGGALLIRDALSSRRVVIESFDTPSALATRGITGKVIAGGLLGELDRLQAATRSSAAKRDLTNAWSAEPELALPEAGVSLGDLSRLLKRQFGHDLHIEGDLVQTEAGDLELTVRGDGIAQKTFYGKANQLSALTAQMAEYVYGQSEPALYATYLSNAGRDTEMITFCQAAYAGASISDRPYLLNAWSVAVFNTGGSLQQSLLLLRNAVKIKPDFWVAYANIQNVLWALADEEGAWRAGEDLRRAAGGRPGRAPEQTYENWDMLTLNLPADLHALLKDAEANAGAGTQSTALGPQLADIYSRMHDPAGAELELQTTKPDSNDPTIEAITHFVRGLLASEAGDAVTAVNEMEALRAGYANPIVSRNFPGYDCFIAPAEEAAGHPDKADAVLNAAGKLVDCYRFRGDILDHRGDWAGAQKAYADAVALAPDLPAAYYSWGVALGRHGDFVAAVEKLREANQHGPHWADPLKAWGDILAVQGKRDEAYRKYDNALEYAPNWRQLKEAREALAKRRA